MKTTSGIVIFTIVVVLADLHIVYADLGNCTVNPGSFGTCFKDETSGRTWQDRLIQLTPAANDSMETCDNYRVNQVETQPCYKPNENISSYWSASCEGEGWVRCNNGRCIKMGLVCNGDDDCGDASDEYPTVNNRGYNCTNHGDYICGIPVTTSNSNTPPKSDRYFLGIPGLENFAAGFDLLTGMRRGDVLSMRPLGSCRRILKYGEEDYYYRLPNNVNSLSQIFAIDHASGQIAATAADVLTTTQEKLGLDYSFGGYLGSLDSAVGLSQSETLKSFTLESIQTKNRFLAVTTTSKIRVFKVGLKSSQNLEASNAFLQRLYSLPRTNISYESYLSFIQDFGTHYFSSGVLGGQYSMVNLYDRCWIDSELEQTYAMDRSEWEARLQFCDRQSLKNKLDPNYVISSECTLGSATTGTDILSKAVSTVSNIEGGSVSTSSALQDSFTSATWQAWANSVQDTPTLIMEDFELTRISKLLDYPIPTLTSAERQQVQTFLDEAIDIYLQPYDASTYCDCTNTCEADSYGGVTTSYLTGTSGQEYYCRCACDNSPSIADCNRSTKTYISHVAMFISLLLSTYLVSDSKAPVGR